MAPYHRTRRYVRLLATLCASATLPSAVVAQVPTTLTLEHAVALASGSSPTFLSTQNDQAAANWQVREA